MQMISVRCIVWAFDSAQVKPLPGTLAEKNAKRGSWDALVLNALDLALGPRELSWQGPTMPKTLRRALLSQECSKFLRLRIRSLALHVILADILQVALQSFSPELNSPVGGSVFDTSLPPLERYIRSTAMSFLFGCTIYATTHAVYDGLSLLAVLVVRQSPMQWPPLFYSPWRATSLKELWGSRWHQLNRRWMINLGAKPASRLFGPVGGVLAPFALSGLVHDIGLRGVGRGSDFIAVFGFFFMMGVGVLLESAWTNVSGKTPSGITGWLWTYGWMALWGSSLVNAWLMRGEAAAGLVPEPYGPSKLIWTFISQKLA